MSEPTPMSSSVDVPEAGTPGRLRTRLLDRLMVRVARRRGDQLWLVPLTGDIDGLWGGEPVLLECINRRGLLCVRGYASILESGLISLQIVDRPEVLQRREYVRLSAERTVSIVCAHGGRKIARSVNLSGGGMLLDDLYELELGDRVHFRIELRPDEPAVEGWARVVRIGRQGERAFQFEDISRKHRERLIHFIFDRQRAALALARRNLA